MCGIAGFYGFRDDDLIRDISLQLRHRGPDGEGVYLSDKATLLSRRLAIIDVKGGDQPIYNEDKTVAVVYNGEIYNYQELRQELETKGHVFTTKSDTEVIAHGYEEWGTAGFDRFNAMFGISLYDSKKDILILARDHFGIKPLYFTFANDKNGHLKHLLFASEIKPLLKSGYVDKIPNDKVIYRYLRYRIHDDTHETFFTGVYKLMPGELLIVEQGRMKKQLFSHLEQDLLAMEHKPHTATSITHFKNLLVKSVQARLVSEVLVGTCLSGGLDSSTVVAIVNKLLKDNAQEASSVGDIQKSFSAVFPDATNNEEKYIDELVKDITQITDYKIYPKPEEFFRELQDFVKTQEEPTISTGPYAQYKVMQEAHKHVTVVLDGQGADEMMAGYLPYYFVYLRQLKSRSQFLKLCKECLAARDVLFKYGVEKIKRMTGLVKVVDAKVVLNKKFAESHAKEKYRVTQDNLKKRLIEDIFLNSLPSLLRYEDKNSMRFSIEGRVPFLDFNLICYLFSLDDEAIIKDGWNKYILRQAVKDLLPQAIVNRRNKIGFTTPEYDWFMRMKNKIYAIFLSESFANRSYFNQPAVLKAFEEFIAGRNTDTLVFWRLLNLELWLQIYFDAAETEAETSIKEKGYFEANSQKQIKIEVEGKTYYRFPIKTALFKKDDDIKELVGDYVKEFLTKLKSEPAFRDLLDKKWFVVLSEKIVAIAQGRSYLIWDIKPSFAAKMLSKFVKKTPYGIGLGSPWTMQIAISEVGLPRIAFAALLSAITKPLGYRGLFYQLVGKEVAAIDGPTEYSLYPSNVSAKLGPKDPQREAEQIKEHIRKHQEQKETDGFAGVVIIDANDIGRVVLGNATPFSDALIAEIFNDNPMGQSDEQTPLTIVFVG